MDNLGVLCKAYSHKNTNLLWTTFEMGTMINAICIPITGCGNEKSFYIYFETQCSFFAFSF